MFYGFIVMECLTLLQNHSYTKRQQDSSCCVFVQLWCILYIPLQLEEFEL